MTSQGVGGRFLGVGERFLGVGGRFLGVGGKVGLGCQLQLGFELSLKTPELIEFNKFPVINMKICLSFNSNHIISLISLIRLISILT